MGIAELINKEKKTAFSFEVLPPLKGTGIEKLYATIDTLREFDPLYVNITTHRSEYVYRELGGGLYERNRYRRRPGTVAVAAAIHNKYDITVVPHILCSGFSREDTEYILLDLQFLGITNLLVLRGDKAKDESSFVPEKDGYAHALELEEQINAFNEGKFIDELKKEKDYYTLWNEPQGDFSIKNGETYQEVVDRVLDFIEEKYKENKKCIFITIHGMLFTILNGLFLNLPIEHFNEVNQNIVRGCSLSLFEYNGKEFRIDYIGNDDFLEPRKTKISYK